ncbi:MAG: hypothetical protein J6V99_04640 [Neisseriaceae bacterium]|nr:hypothetical protein [Neisseriaceae bacterium]
MMKKIVMAFCILSAVCLSACQTKPVEPVEEILFPVAIEPLPEKTTVKKKKSVKPKKSSVTQHQNKTDEVKQSVSKKSKEQSSDDGFKLLSNSPKNR